MNVEFFMAARARLVYDGQDTLAGALLVKSDDDPLVRAVEDSFATYYGKKVMAPLDVVEHAIATRVDAGEKLPISNTEAYGAAKWISQEGLASLPDPMPRGFVLYFAMALVETGQFASMDKALAQILTTKTFI